jgi:AcrR family transcriptional regulator
MDHTNRHIADAFLSLTRRRPYQEITVTDIIEAAGCSRRTYYYHFKDKQDLVIWIFRSEFSEELKRVFPPISWVCDTELPDEKYRNYVFYADMRTKNQKLDLSVLWRSMSGCLSKREWYYAQVLRSGEPNNLRDYLFRIYIRQLKKDIEYYLENNEDNLLSPDVINFFSEYFCNACLGWIINFHSGIYTKFDEGAIYHSLGNLSHELMKYAVDSYKKEVRTAIKTNYEDVIIEVMRTGNIV